MQKLNLGCGKDIREGYINLDKVKMNKVNVIHNLNKFPYPFKSDYFDEVLAKDILEHIKDLALVLQELHRILKINGVLKITVPHFTSRYAFTDPTHRNFFGYESFKFFEKGHPKNYYYSFSFSRVIAKIMFKNHLIYSFVNISDITRRFYENSFRIVPARNIEITAIK